MLSTNVLCIKKKKKRSYCIVKTAENGGGSLEKNNKRSVGGAATMLQITEDTPPDMLAGAMDLTVHLPTGRAVKMSVERSTPMMDLLVQVTTNYHLQLSGYTLQALGMAPSKEHSDRILPYKPNTPIGALDTQHIRVVPKARNASVPKNVPPGHQPFESTFRLKVHLPRNQLFVTRVSQSVQLQEIMKKVCEEKNLDPLKYEFRHPGNLDEILDPKLTLSDYTITEIYLVQKGSLSQSFTTGDIMALRKEEERKQMHTKTGGGVFNLIFRRGGKSSSGSLSSENRSISPTHSDDSRSVTPPGVPPPQEPAERPKPPQRKRRPAPKPPSEAPKSETTLTICHSRNSSDSSGYHEASVLSDNNTSLPRRPKSTMITESQHSNLSKMSAHSKSTSSLAFSRKKKTAPPPPVLKTEKNLEEPSPVVASQPCTVAEAETPGQGNVALNTNPKPTPRIRTKAPRPRSLVSLSSEEREEETAEAVNGAITHTAHHKLDPIPDQEPEKRTHEDLESKNEEPDPIPNQDPEKRTHEDLETKNGDPGAIPNQDPEKRTHEDSEEPALSKFDPSPDQQPEKRTHESLDIGEPDAPHEKNPEHLVRDNDNPKQKVCDEKIPDPDINENIKQKVSQLAELQKQTVSAIFNTTAFVTKPEIVALHPKSVKKDGYPKSIFGSNSRKTGFQIGSSLLEEESKEQYSSDLSAPNSVDSALRAFDFVDEIEDLDEEMFKGSFSKNSKNKNVILNQLHGMHDLDRRKNPSGGSLRSVSSLPGFVGGNMKKWSNVEDLDDISLHSFNGTGWVMGDTSDTESVGSTNQRTPLDSLASVQSLPSTSTEQKKEVEETTTKTEEETTTKPIEEETTRQIEEEPTKKTEEVCPKDTDLETEWQYQLPSPPKAFRDSSPVAFVQESADSVVTSPELFEKLKEVKEKETGSDLTSVVSEEDRPILNKLSLENLEKRKSLVYNRELATSLKMQDEEKKDTFSTSLTNFDKTYEEVKRSSPKQAPVSTLPNFKITTYNNPKKKLDIFEDDTIRSNDPASKRHSFTEPFPLQSAVGRSMENISFRKNSHESDFKFFKPPVPKSVFRSESFSKEQTWVPTKPVTRSKSQIALNKYKESKSLTQVEDDNLTKSNSLFDVSGLQSLGVMRLIQNKLNTPNTSTEQLDKEESYQKQPEMKIEVQTEEKPKIYKYRPPSVNMGTWSDRPKIPVNVKEDPDYKYSVKDTNTSRLVVNTVNNEIKSHNSIEVRNKTTFTNGVSVRVGPEPTKNIIKVNGSEPVQNSGNVVIKIGGANSHKPLFRKPLGNVNTENQRPHSIAFGSDFDISRVPVVRSVEFKKPYRDFGTTTNNNTSITQIYSNNNNNFKNWSRNGHDEPAKSSEPVKPQVEPKPVFRVNSYLQNASAPVVRGFRNNNEVNRLSWNQPHSFSTLPSKSAKNFALSGPVPFSQSNLRRAESTNVPPPAPVMPKFQKNVKRDDCGDPKEQLLQAIRDFGGKKGLRAVKA